MPRTGEISSSPARIPHIVLSHIGVNPTERPTPVLYHLGRWQTRNEQLCCVSDVGLSSTVTASPSSLGVYAYAWTTWCGVSTIVLFSVRFVAKWYILYNRAKVSIKKWIESCLVVQLLTKKYCDCACCSKTTSQKIDSINELIAQFISLTISIPRYAPSASRGKNRYNSITVRPCMHSAFMT